MGKLRQSKGEQFVHIQPEKLVAKQNARPTLLSPSPVLCPTAFPDSATRAERLWACKPKAPGIALHFPKCQLWWSVQHKGLVRAQNHRAGRDLMGRLVQPPAEMEDLAFLNCPRRCLCRLFWKPPIKGIPKLPQFAHCLTVLTGGDVQPRSALLSLKSIP